MSAAKLLELGKQHPEALRVAAGLGDPAARRAARALKLTPRPNALTAADVAPLAQLGFPVREVELVFPKLDVVQALDGVGSLRSLTLIGPEFSFDAEPWQLLVGWPLEQVKIEGFGVAAPDQLAWLVPGRTWRCLQLDSSSSYPEWSDALLGQLAQVRLTELDLERCEELSDEGLRVLAKLPLTRLRLAWAGEITRQGLAHLTKLPLVELDLSHCGSLAHGNDAEQDAEEEDANNFEVLASFAKLERLVLDGTYAGDDALQAVRKLKALRSLSLADSYVSEEGLELLAGLELRELRLNGAREFEDVGRALAHLQGLPLEALGLGGVERLRETDLALLKSFNRLTALDLSLTTGLSGQGLANLEGLPLQRLDLGFGDLSAEALEAVCGLGLPLRSLDLTGAKLEEADLRQLQRLPKLEELIFQFDAKWLTTAGLKHLLDLPLRRLVLGQAKLDDDAVDVFARMQRLETLWLPNRSLSAAAWAKLQAIPARVH